MKSGVKQIIGKTISGVVVKESKNSPRTQLFLLFNDGTYYEFYSGLGDICGAGGVDRGGIHEVNQYLSGSPDRKIVFSSVNEVRTGKAIVT